MGNRIEVMDKNRKVIGEMYASLACFAIVSKLVDKYNPGANLYSVEKVNDVLSVVYDKCEGWEEVQLLVFINDKSRFDESDIPKFDEAIARYSMENEGPKRHLVFMRDMLAEHKELITEYRDSTMAITVVRANN